MLLQLLPELLLQCWCCKYCALHTHRGFHSREEVVLAAAVLVAAAAAS
jgi:hypothetical protein